MRVHTDRAEAEMAVHVDALTKPVGELIEAVLRKHNRAVLDAVKELHDRCTKAERQRDELAAALRETAKKLSAICADFNMTRMIMNDDKARYLAGEFVAEGRAQVDNARALLARLGEGGEG